LKNKVTVKHTHLIMLSHQAQIYYLTQSIITKWSLTLIIIVYSNQVTYT